MKNQKFYDKLEPVLGLCDRHLFQGIAYVPTDETTPLRHGAHFCRFCRSRLDDPGTAVHCRRSVLQAGELALHTGEPSYTICWLGLSSFVVPVAPRGRLIGAITVGGYALSDDQKESAALQASTDSAAPADADRRRTEIDDLPVVSPFEIRQAALFVWDTLLAAGLNNARVILERHETHQLQRRIAEQIHQYQETRAVPASPIDLLPPISAGLRNGERDRVMLLLNDYCCRVLLHEASDHERVKAHFYLLSGLLTREKTLSGGLSMEVALYDDQHALREMMEMNNIEDMCYWMYRRVVRYFDARLHPSGSPMKLRERLLEWLQRNHGNKVTLEIAAEEVGASVSSIVKCLKKETGRTFLQHLHAIRLNQAKELLATTDCTVGEIADQCGYYDPSHFSHRFKTEVGMTPMEFRRSCAA